MADSPYAEARGRLRLASGDITSATGGLRQQWQDAAASAADPQLTGVGERLAELKTALGRREEAHGVVDRLSALASGHAEAVDRLVAEAQSAVGEADQALGEASGAADQARAAASASSGRVREVLQMAGQAGAGCGQGSGSEALEGLWRGYFSSESRASASGGCW